jgi:hypothetical protein
LDQHTAAVTSEELFSILADRLSVTILTAANHGFKSSFGKALILTKKQYYTRLNLLIEIGLIKKLGSFYKLTTLGHLIYNNHLMMMDKLIPDYWDTKAIDTIKKYRDFPISQKENIIDNYFSVSNLKDNISPATLTSFNIIKKFDHLIPEVLKVLDNAEKEVYFATKYHDPHVSNLVFKKFSKRVRIHILDGNPEQISVENRLKAIMRTPPNKETAQMINKLVRSRRFDLKRLSNLPISFMVVDGIQVVYETVNFINPQQFTISISKYDDPYLARQFIDYFRLLSQDAVCTCYSIT